MDNKPVNVQALKKPKKPPAKKPPKPTPTTARQRHDNAAMEPMATAAFARDESALARKN